MKLKLTAEEIMNDIRHEIKTNGIFTFGEGDYNSVDTEDLNKFRIKSSIVKYIESKYKEYFYTEPRFGVGELNGVSKTIIIGDNQGIFNCQISEYDICYIEHESKSDIPFKYYYNVIEDKVLPL